MIEVVEYRPAWSERFRQLHDAYAAALDAAAVPFRSIEHVGSTSVPGLAAKPVLDVDVVVDAADVPAAVAAMAMIGFESRGELGVPGRQAFRTPERFAPTNTYVITVRSLALRNHLALRDVLRADPALRDEYAAVKRRAASEAEDIDDYIERKSEVLGRILHAGGLSDDERAAITATNRRITDRGAAG
ncbi:MULTISPECIES: GrpB family protein [Curtobacterium]|uniref:GrpB family protein n=1 Tax=Curtobacterium TaxID=2034 RepID=UPI00217D58D3|nr:GrpB family protein [Curtobacterium flaccumfaciens]MCS6562494.1 GrpB family protein [Curtobacterium flaccumfaciens pv. poinsettiae]UXN28546.1 GrpB family protein [Curtobacterium flaccumfaciens]